MDHINSIKYSQIQNIGVDNNNPRIAASIGDPVSEAAPNDKKWKQPVEEQYNNNRKKLSRSRGKKKSFKK